jgi:hypothetical protein
MLGLSKAKLYSTINEKSQQISNTKRRTCTLLKEITISLNTNMVGNLQLAIRQDATAHRPFQQNTNCK